MRLQPKRVFWNMTAITLLLWAGCSHAVQTNSGKKSFDAGSVHESETGSAAEMSESNAAGANAGFSRDGHQRLGDRYSGSPFAQTRSDVDTSATATEYLPQSSFPSLSGAVTADSNSGTDRLLQPLTDEQIGNEERMVSDSIMVAEAESIDAAKRQAERYEQERAAAIAGGPAGLQDVFFSFDSWSLTEEAKQALSKDAEWLRMNSGKSLIVEGHCDERGTADYNLVLGEKRARAVRSYLMELGIKNNAITAVSYGKERPVCRSSDEGCYQQNRRGHFALRAR
jgi:peptidoglycan-associated lipoprotein